jgi:16S rRNA (cytidine1402-2'-O)-methyltransferase
MSKGCLYLIPIPLVQDKPISDHIPQEVFNVINEIDVFMVENIKTTRRYLRKMEKSYPIDDKIFHVVNKRTSVDEVSKLLDQSKGKIIGVMSEAGCPGIADPGEKIVDAAHQQKIKVKPLVGPSSILLALIASGKNGQEFTFNGYLPKERGGRVKKIKQLENLSGKGITQIFMETPFRNNHLLEDLLLNLDNNAKLCIATNINGQEEVIKTKFVKDWKNNPPNLNKKPTIFVL